MLDIHDGLRKIYIDKFIDVKKEYYVKCVKKLKEYSDGMCYTGYLWDCMKESTQIDFQDFLKFLLEDVYVFWDIHTKERIFIEDYWKFEKRSFLKLDFKVLIENLNYLPEDIYIFDQSLLWTLVLTHEYVDDKRWCLKSGEI